jgi:hypothetical protein
MPLDITISPLYRVDGKDQPSLPGLMAAVPPRNAARGREEDRLVVYLVLAGKAVLSSGDGVQAASRAAVAYFETPGTITSALRTAATSINEYLHNRNITSPGGGKYAVGLLALIAVREEQLTLLLSGPMHAFVLNEDGTRHVFEHLSGRGLGLSPTTPYYFSQIDLQAGDRVVIAAVLPEAWEVALRDSSPASLEATRRRLMASTDEDFNGMLLQASEGDGLLTLQRLVIDEKAAALERARVQMEAADPGSVAEAKTPPPILATAEQGGVGVVMPADVEAETEWSAALPAGPSAYAIPPNHSQAAPIGETAESSAPPTTAAPESVAVSRRARASRDRLRLPPEAGRETARKIVRGLDTYREFRRHAAAALGRFLPRLLPSSDRAAGGFGSPAMMFIAVLVPLVVVTVASAVYLRYGRSVQYEQYLVQAQDARAQAVSLTDAVAQREAWQRELFYLDKAESYTSTSDTRGLRAEAERSLDDLLGIVRLEFQPALSTGVGAPIGRLAAGDNDLFLLDSERGKILHLALLNNGFQLDTAFNCEPGSYGGYTVGPVVDIVAMPPINTINASVVGVDAAGTLIYCAPGQVAQAIPLPPPDTNWGRVRAITMDAGNLYVLDAQAHAVWVYVGKDGTFVDRPYFFFGGQIPELEDAIDIAVTADDLYVLHADGRVSTCSYSRLESVPTRCVDPAVLVNTIAAYRDQDIFSDAHFTQMMIGPAPDPALLMLDTDGQGVFRFSPRSLELQSQLRPQAGRGNIMPQGPVTAMAVSPNHVLYYALRDRVYFASDAP